MPDKHPTSDQEVMLLEILAELTLTDPGKARAQLLAGPVPRHYPHIWDALVAASLWNSQGRKGL